MNYAAYPQYSDLHTNFACRHICLYVLECAICCKHHHLCNILHDGLAGWLSRKDGKVLDPLADKLMLVAVLVCFFINDSIPRWILIVIAAEEFIMILVGAILYFMKIVVYSDWFGKIATGLFAVAIVFTFVHIIGEHNYGVNIFGWAEYVFIAAVAASLIAFVHYGINIIKGHYSDSTPAKN